MATIKMRKVSALLIVSALLTSLLAACSSGDNANKDGTASGSPAAQTQEPTEISVMRLLWSDEVKFSPDNDLVKAINEAANVVLKYELTDYSEYANKLNLTMSGGELPDIIYVDDTVKYAEYGIEGAFLPLDEYLDKYPAVRDAISTDSWQELRNASADQKIYFLPLYVGKSSFMNVYRKDWLEKLQIEEPKTTDEFYDMLVKIRDGDLDGNGQKDTIPLAMSATSVFYQARDLAPLFGIVWPTDWMVDPENPDRIILGAMSPKVKDFLQFVRKLRQEGLLDSEFIVGKKSGRDKFIAGNVGVVVAHVNEIAVIQEDLAKTNPDAAVDVMSAMTGPNGDIGGAELGSINAGGFAINAKSKDKIDKIFEYLNWQATAGKDMVDFGIEGKTYVIEDGVKKIMPTDQIPEEYQGLPVLKLVFNQEWTDAHHNWLRNFPTKEAFDAYMVKINSIVDNGIWDEAARYKLSTADSQKYGASLKPMIEEFMSKAILEQNFDIDAEWDKLKDKWYKSGGQAVTDSFNEQWTTKKG